MNKKALLTFGILTLAGVTLASCAKNPLIVTRINCPATAVTAGASILSKFKGDNRNAEDLMYNATISHIERICVQDGETVTATVKFMLMVQQGPAFEGSEVTVPYFTALIRDNNLITAKRQFDTTVRFASNETSAGSVETIVQHFKDIEIARRYDYELLIGFQLSADEVTYNLTR
jgi:hypothetical protein